MDQSKTFGALLVELFAANVRPRGSRPQQPWTNATFAAACDVDERSVRNWRNDRNLPFAINTIERAFYGPAPPRDQDPDFAHRYALRLAHARGLQPQRGKAAGGVQRQGGAGLPAPIAHFVGRADALAFLHEHLVCQPDKPVTLVGLPGIGKTSLARRFVELHGDRFAGVLWCNAETEALLVGSLAGHAWTLGLASARATPDVAARTLIKTLSEEPRSWLLIYDNAPRLALADDWWPHGALRLLLTSLSPDWGGLTHVVETPLLTASESAAFLGLRTGRQTDPAPLIAVLDNLPLALEHAAAFCLRTGVDYETYATRVEALVAHLPQSSAYPRSLKATFTLAIEAAVRQAPGAEAVMRRAMLCAPQGVSVALLTAGGDAEALMGLAALGDFSLVRPLGAADAPRVAIHRLVQTIARLRAGPATLDATVEDLIADISGLFPEATLSDASTWPLASDLAEQIVSLEAHAPAALARATLWPRVLNRLGRLAHGQGRLVESHALRERGLALLTGRAVGEDMAEALNGLGLLEQEMAAFDSARRRLLQSLRTRRALGQRRSLEWPQTLSNLGQVYNALGRPRRALFWFRASRTRLEAIAPSSDFHATALSNLAVCHERMGELEQAIALTEAALAMRRERFKDEMHRSVLLSRHNLAYLRVRRGAFAEAATELFAVLKARRRVLGVRHPDTMRTLFELGRALEHRNDDRLARLFIARASRLTGAMLGPDHPTSAYMRACWARTLAADTPQRAEFTKACLDLLVARLGPNHPWTVTVAAIHKTVQRP